MKKKINIDILSAVLTALSNLQQAQISVIAGKTNINISLVAKAIHYLEKHNKVKLVHSYVFKGYTVKEYALNNEYLDESKYW